MKEEIVDKLEKLKEYMKILESYQDTTLDELKDNVTLRGAVERYLELAIECVIDISEMVISREGLKRPDKYREVIEVLGENGVLPEIFAKELAPAAGFRNILVHLYDDIDVKEVHKNLKNKLNDFDRFSKYIAKYLKKKQ